MCSRKMNGADFFSLFCIFCFITRWTSMIVVLTVGGAVFMYSCQVLAIVRGWQIFIRGRHESLSKSDDEELVGVSIIKPLKGISVNLEGNLETFFTQNYHEFEILFCLEDKNDPSVPVIKRLVAKYPKTKVKILVGKEYVGLNEKVNNMARGYRNSKYNLILFSDSCHRVRHDTLKEQVRQMIPGVGQLFQLPCIIPEDCFAAIYEKVYFGTMYLRSCLTSDALGIPFSVGSSTLVRKDVLDKTGGLAALGNYLAEDHFMSINITKTGYRKVLSYQPAMLQSCCSIPKFNERIIRWSQLHAAIFPALMFLEPFGECFLLGLTMSWALNSMFQGVMLYAFFCHCLIWFSLDYLLLTVTEGGQLPFTVIEFLCAWVLRELTSLYLTTRSHMASTVKWHGRKYRLKWGGEIESVQIEGIKKIPGSESKDSNLKKSLEYAH